MPNCSSDLRLLRGRGLVGNSATGILVPTRVSPFVFDKLRNLDQSLFSDATPLFDGKRVIGRLKLNQRSFAHCLGSNVRFEGCCVGIDFDSA